MFNLKEKSFQVRLLKLTQIYYPFRGIAKGTAESFVNDEKACSAEFLVTVPDILDKYKPSTS